MQSLALANGTAWLWLAVALGIVPLHGQARRIFKIEIGLVCLISAGVFADLFFGTLGGMLNRVHGALIVQSLFIVVPLPSLICDPVASARLARLTTAQRTRRNVALGGLGYLLLAVIAGCIYVLRPFGAALTGWIPALVTANPALFCVLIALTLSTLAVSAHADRPLSASRWLAWVLILIGILGSAVLTLLGVLVSAAYPA